MAAFALIYEVLILGAAATGLWVIMAVAAAVMGRRELVSKVTTAMIGATVGLFLLQGSMAIVVVSLFSIRNFLCPGSADTPSVSGLIAMAFVVIASLAGAATGARWGWQRASGKEWTTIVDTSFLVRVLRKVTGRSAR